MIASTLDLRRGRTGRSLSRTNSEEWDIYQYKKTKNFRRRTTHFWRSLRSPRPPLLPPQVLEHGRRPLHRVPHHVDPNRLHRTPMFVKVDKVKVPVHRPSSESSRISDEIPLLRFGKSLPRRQQGQTLELEAVSQSQQVKQGLHGGGGAFRDTVVNQYVGIRGGSVDLVFGRRAEGWILGKVSVFVLEPMTSPNVVQGPRHPLFHGNNSIAELKPHVSP